MYHTAVIADDFTSVTDCTMPFACRGLSTAAMLSVPEGDFPQARILGMNTDSRTVEPKVAYDRNKAAALVLKQAGCTHIYKSVDSTLRGNLGAEIDGVMDGLELPLALVAPAFPHYGRTTLEGIHYLNGARLEDSPIARDPACPATESEIAKILAAQSDRKSGRLGLDVVRDTTEAFAAAVSRLQAEGCSFIIPDVETEEDLGRVAAHSTALARCLVVGSTGLSRHVAEQWCTDDDTAAVPAPQTEQPVIVAAASVSPVTAGQVERLLEEPGVARCLISPTQAAFGSMEEYAARAEAILKDGLDLVLQVDSSPEARAQSEQAAREAGLTRTETAARIAGAMSALTAGLLSAGLGGAVVMTGGDMAQAVLETFCSPGMELWGEVEPGIPAGRLMGATPCLAVTKAGAFGTPDALRTARSILKKTH